LNVITGDRRFKGGSGASILARYQGDLGNEGESRFWGTFRGRALFAKTAALALSRKNSRYGNRLLFEQSSNKSVLSLKFFGKGYGESPFFKKGFPQPSWCVPPQERRHEGGERTAPPAAKGNLLRKVSFRILPKLFSTDHVQLSLHSMILT